MALFKKKSALIRWIHSLNHNRRQLLSLFCFVCWMALLLKTVQDFLCKLDMKPHKLESGNKHLLTISGQRQTYQCYQQSRQKLCTFLENKVFLKNINKSWSTSLIFFKEKKIRKIQWFLMLKNDFENQNFEIFEEVVDYFGRCDDDSEKMPISTRCIP